MLNLEQRTALYGQLSDNVNYTGLLLSDFLIAQDDEEIRKKIPTVGWSYAQAIIINLAKIFSLSPNEHFRLERFRELKSENIDERIDRLLTKHALLIKKVVNNRDKLFAHTDKAFFKLLYSKEEVTRMEVKFNTVFTNLLAKSKDSERFTPTDINKDQEDIRDILYELEGIWNEALMSDQDLMK